MANDAIPRCKVQLLGGFSVADSNGIPIRFRTRATDSIFAYFTAFPLAFALAGVLLEKSGHERPASHAFAVAETSLRGLPRTKLHERQRASCPAIDPVSGPDIELVISALHRL